MLLIDVVLFLPAQYITTVNGKYPSGNWWNIDWFLNGIWVYGSWCIKIFVGHGTTPNDAQINQN